MKHITFNVNDPVAECLLADALAQGQQQTKVITRALRQAASAMDAVSPREQAFGEEITRLHRLIAHIAATGREGMAVAPSRAHQVEPTTSPEGWTW